MGRQQAHACDWYDSKSHLDDKGNLETSYTTTVHTAVGCSVSGSPQVTACSQIWREISREFSTQWMPTPSHIQQWINIQVGNAHTELCSSHYSIAVQWHNLLQQHHLMICLFTALPTWQSAILKVLWYSARNIKILFIHNQHTFHFNSCFLCEPQSSQISLGFLPPLEENKWILYSKQQYCL